MNIYISGPITGMPDLNREAFYEAQRFWEFRGWEVVNVFEIHVSEDGDWLNYIVEDLLILNECDALFMLKGWFRSYGARIEHLAAQKLGKEIYYEI